MQDAVSARLGDWIAEGWRMFAEQWQVWVVSTVVVLAIASISILPIYIGIWAAFIGIAVTAQQAPSATPLLITGVVILFMVLLLALLTLSAFLSSGLHRTALKQLRGEKILVSDLFSGGRYFLRVAGAIILMWLLSLIGFLMCFLPAFLVGGLFYFTIFLIVDRDLGTLEAMRTSYETCKKNVLWFTLFALIVILIGQAGSYVLYIGILVSYPLAFTIGAVAYRDCFDVPGMRTFNPPPPATPPPYYYPPQYSSPPYATPSFMDPSQRPAADATSQPSTGSQHPQPDLGLCPSCKTPLARPARFCASCGNPINLR